MSHTNRIALGLSAAATIMAAVALFRTTGPSEGDLRRLLNDAPQIADAQRERAQLQRVALLLAVNQLHTAVMSGAPFAAEHALAAQLAKGRSDAAADLATLAPISKEGVPTLRLLTHEFERRAADALVNERTPAESGWLGQTYGRLSAVTVALLMEARVNPLNSPSAPVIRDMQQAIVHGELRAAIEATAKLPAPAQETFAPWVELARRRIDALEAAKRLVPRALAALDEK